MRAAARFVQEHADCFPAGAAPQDPAQVAVLAIEAYEVFLDRSEAGGEAGSARPDREVAEMVIAAGERFEVARIVARAR